MRLDPVLQVDCGLSIADVLSDPSRILSYLHPEDSGEDGQHFTDADVLFPSDEMVTSQDSSPPSSCGDLADQGVPDPSSLSFASYSNLHGCPSLSPNVATNANPHAATSIPSAHFSQSSGKARRNKIKREKWRDKKKAKGKIAQSSKKQEKSAMRLAERLARTQTIVVTQLAIASLATTESGLAGSLRKAATQTTSRLRDDPDYYQGVLKSLRLIPYDYSQRRVADFRDVNGIRFGLRSFRDRRMDKPFMERLVQRIDAFANACRVRVPEMKHKRGAFAQAILGYNHGIGEGDNEPYRTAFHRRNAKAADELLQSAEMQLVIKIATELMERYFPGIASLCRGLDAFWYEKGSEKPRMEFGLFYNMAINVDINERVKSIPHRDSMNLAWGVCALMPFGFFPDGVLAWLVNLEAGVIIQIPAGVFYFFLSAMITHYNADRHEFWAGETRLDLVTTERWEWPTSSNTKPLEAIGSGRGSLVFYNQGSAFHWKLTGEKKKEGAIKKYGSVGKLAEAMAVVAQECLSPV